MVNEDIASAICLRSFIEKYMLDADLGMLENIIRLMKKTLADMTENTCLCVISFDEMVFLTK